jgi:hypothetical protein
MTSSNKAIAADGGIEILVCDEPGAVRFEYERPCGRSPAYSIWLWGSEDLTHFGPDGTERDTVTVMPQDVLTADITASSFGRVVSYDPVPLEEVELRHRGDVEHMLTWLAGDEHEPLRFKGGRRWWIVAESFEGIHKILRLRWIREHHGRELPGYRYVIEFEWDPH